MRALLLPSLLCLQVLPLLLRARGDEAAETDPSSLIAFTVGADGRMRRRSFQSIVLLRWRLWRRRPGCLGTGAGRPPTPNLGDDDELGCVGGGGGIDGESDVATTKVGRGRDVLSVPLGVDTDDGDVGWSPASLSSRVASSSSSSSVSVGGGIGGAAFAYIGALLARTRGRGGGPGRAGDFTPPLYGGEPAVLSMRVPPPPPVLVLMLLRLEVLVSMPRGSAGGPVQSNKQTP